MSNVALSPARASHVATTLVVLLTVICGGGYAYEGACLLVDWAGWLPVEPGGVTDRILVQSGLALLGGIGAFFLTFGIVTLLAALGQFWRQKWGHVLTLLVAAVAAVLGLCLLDIGPSIIVDTSNFPLGAAQILYGIIVLAVLSANRDEPLGVYIVRLMSFLIGVPNAFFWAMWATDLPPGSTLDDFAFLSVLGGCGAGLLLVGCGTCLLLPPWKRFAPFVLMLAAGAELAMALFAVLCAVLGHGGGLREAFFLVLVLPLAIVLLVLTAGMAWYLTRPPFRTSFD